MQILVQAICTPGTSLRTAIVDDPKLEENRLAVAQQKKNTRSNGWAKLHSTERDRHGALNIEWEGNSAILLCRVITKGNGRPNQIIGDFVDYLLRRHHRRIKTINIIPC